MHQRLNGHFNIFLPVADVVRIFGERLNLSCIAAVPQGQPEPCLIFNILEQTDTCIPSVNETTDIEIAPELMQLMNAFPCNLQMIWDADPSKGPVQASKLDVTDVYHHGLRNSLAVPGGRIHIRCPIRPRRGLHHNLRRSSPANVMGGFTQVLLRILRDVGICCEPSGGNKADCPVLFSHSQNIEHRTRPSTQTQ